MQLPGNAFLDQVHFQALLYLVLLRPQFRDLFLDLGQLELHPLGLLLERSRLTL